MRVVCVGCVGVGVVCVVWTCGAVWGVMCVGVACVQVWGSVGYVGVRCVSAVCMWVLRGGGCGLRGVWSVWGLVARWVSCKCVWVVCVQVLWGV